MVIVFLLALCDVVFDNTPKTVRFIAVKFFCGIFLSSFINLIRYSKNIKVS